MEKQFVYSNKDIDLDCYSVKKYEIGIATNLPECRKIKVKFVCCNEELDLNIDDVSYFEPQETGDQYSKKICNVCHRLLEVENFQKNQNGKGDRTVRRPSCNDCRKVIDGENMKNSEKKKMQEIMPSFEIWTCPICKKTTIPGITSKVVCDHDHKTGHPRAWICDSCNTGLGRFKDDISTLESAIEYLKSYNFKE